MSARPGRTLDWDEGVASERTVLAWERTAIASVAVAVLVVRAGVVERLLALAIPIAALLVLGGALEWLVSRRIYIEHDRPFARGAVVHDRAVLVLAAVTVISAGGSAALAISG
jgi:uncharacterized membrane protein YidH (DUF202 family)